MIIREITALANMDGFGLPSPISGVLFGGEDQAHKFIIRREDGTAFAGTVTAKFLRYADDVTVPLTGSIEDGAATVTLIENCYMRPGRFKLTMYVTESESTTAVYCSMGTVDRTDGQQTIDPSGEINLDVTDLINRINTATASVPADYTALLATIAPTFSASTGYIAGQYVWYNGTLYRFTADHAAGTWTGTDATAAVVGEDIRELKSAVDERPDNLGTDAEDVDLDITDTNGNVLVRFEDGHIKTKEFDSRDLAGKVSIAQGAANAGKAMMVGQDGNLAPTTLPPTVEIDDTLTQEGEAADAKSVGDAISATNEAVEDLEESILKSALTRSTTAQSADLDLTDENGNVLARFSDGHIKTKYFDSSLGDQGVVRTVNNTSPDANGNVDVIAELDPEELADAVANYLDDHPVVAAAAGIVSVADYGAVGDGITDDSGAIQDAVDANYDVYFESNKTYYIASTITINHDIKLHGGVNTIIKTKTPSGGTAPTGFAITGTLKGTTTITTDYTSVGATDNSGNLFTLADMSKVKIGDILSIVATDQYFSYTRQYYYLGGTMLVSDIYDGHLYTTDSLPYDIEKTANVSVAIYDAPTAVVENLCFESDGDNRSYSFSLSLQYCKGSTVRGCEFNNNWNHLQIYRCINTEVDNVRLSKSKYDNTLSPDGYAIGVQSSTNTIIRRVISTCAQGCVNLGGNEPVINTYIQNCDLTSECRTIGIDLHDNSYNLVIEDSVLGGAAIMGTAIVNRCRFIKNNRPSNNGTGIIYRGGTNPDFSTLKVTNCVFDSGLAVHLYHPGTQTPIQAITAYIGNVEIVDCVGGEFYCNPETSTNILANIIKRISIRNWKDVKYILNTSGHTIQYMEIIDTQFKIKNWMQGSGLDFNNNGINYLLVKSNYPKYTRLYVDAQSHGDRYILPANVSISFVSEDTTGHYVVCGENIASNFANDYSVGNVTGETGDVLNRTVNSTFDGSVTTVNDEIVFTQPNNTTSVFIYPKCMTYVPENSTVKMSCKLKNTGGTSGAEFRPYIAAVNCDTGLVTSRLSGTSGVASADGTTITYSTYVPQNNIVMCYLYCNTPVANAETTISEFVAKIMPPELVSEFGYEAYTGTSLDGDGTLNSVSGMNYIMASPSSFDAKFTHDFKEG